MVRPLSCGGGGFRETDLNLPSPSRLCFELKLSSHDVSSEVVRLWFRKQGERKTGATSHR